MDHMPCIAQNEAYRPIVPKEAGELIRAAIPINDRGLHEREKGKKWTGFPIQVQHGTTRSVRDWRRTI